MTTGTAPIDMDAVNAHAERAFGYLTGAVVSAMITLGDKLGLYRSMRGLGPVRSGGLAAHTGLNERWLREWLHGQAAAGIIDYRGDGKFELSAEGALVFADEETPASLFGAFHDLPEQLMVVNRLLESFRTGRVLSYDESGEATTVGTERMLGPWNKTALIDEALPSIPGLVERLNAGAKVADVGCGGGVADIAVAKAFSQAEVHGYDNSLLALSRANDHRREADITNVTFHNADTDPLPSTPTYDLVMCLDCLHDMARPDLAAAAIRKAIKPDGVWFIVDVRSGETFEGNLENPMAAAMYGFSVSLCMSSSASTPDGLALGTVGLPKGKMEALVRAAGFTRFAEVAGMEHPFNAYYEVRP